MFDNPLFETLIAIVLIYAFLSIFVSILTEWWNQRNKTRGKLLLDAIILMLSDSSNESFAPMLYKHPIIDRMRKEEKNLPQYISAESFADALIDVIGEASVTVTKNADGTTAAVATRSSDPLARYLAAVNAMQQSDTKMLLLRFYERSKNEDTGNYEYRLLRQHLMLWFNEHMNRVTGWFKSANRKVTLLFGFLVAIGLNVDSINLIRVFMQDDNLRKEVVEDADQVAGIWKNSTDSVFANKIGVLLDSVSKIKTAADTNDKQKNLAYAVIGLQKLKMISDSVGKSQLSAGTQAIGLLDAYDIPIGWDKEAAPWSWLWFNSDIRSSNIRCLASVKGSYIEIHNNYPNWVAWILYFLGISITGFSLSFGAPFWFDMLIKLVNLRRGGAKPEEKSK